MKSDINCKPALPLFFLHHAEFILPTEAVKQTRVDGECGAAKKNHERVLYARERIFLHGLKR